MNKLIYLLCLLLGSACTELSAQQAIITTYAGTDQAGYTGDWGSATNAKLFNPVGVAVDKWGNLFIAEEANNVVRKVSPDGIISTAAGSGSPGYIGDGAAAIVARLNAPSAVAVDTSGNLFIADAGNCVIRKVTAGGIISTYAGNDTSGCGFSGDLNPAVQAQFRNPYGVAIDPAGDLIINDQGNEVIRKVNTAGIINTIAGIDSEGFSGDGGPAVDAKFDHPLHVTTDANGSIYISDANNGRVRKIAPSGIITTVAGMGITGSFGDGIPATNARLVTPSGLAIDADGNLLISDLGLNQIRKVNTAGIISTIAGSGVQGYGGDNGPPTACKFNRQFGLAVDGNGNIFIADRDNNVVRKISVPVSGINAVTTASSDIVLFPNPTNGALTIKGTLSPTSDEQVSFEVENITGQVVYKNTTITQLGNINKQILLDNTLPDGIYFLHLRGENVNSVLRFQIEK